MCLGMLHPRRDIDRASMVLELHHLVVCRHGCIANADRVSPMFCVDESATVINLSSVSPRDVVTRYAVMPVYGDCGTAKANMWSYDRCTET